MNKAVIARREHTSNALRYGTCSQGILQFYLHTPRSSANRMNHTCLCLSSQRWYSFTDPGGIPSLRVGLGWLVGYIPKNKCLATGIEPGHGHPFISVVLGVGQILLLNRG